MWRYTLLSAPVLALALFYILSFELALLIYLLIIGLAFWLYDWLAARQFPLR